MRQLSPLQRKLRDKALADVAVERAAMLEPVQAVLRECACDFTYTLDEAAENAVSRKIETMLPDWGGVVVAETTLPENRGAMAAALTALAGAHGADCDVILWFEATLHSQCAFVAPEDCGYGIFAGKLADLAAVVGAIKEAPGLPLGWRRLALVSSDHRWMIWIEADRATRCRPAQKP